MGIFESLCEANGKNRSQMIQDMFEEYEQVIRIGYGYSSSEDKDKEYAAIKAVVLSSISVFLLKMAAFNLDEDEVIAAISISCNDPRIYNAFSAIHNSGGVKVYTQLQGVCDGRNQG
jgi:hypothetical protein